MRTEKIVHIVRCHAEGEVGDVIVGGVAPPPGNSVLEQAQWIAADQRLRNFVLNEPRGGVFRHVNLLVPPKSPAAQIGWVIMEPEDTPPMSGSNAICVATVLLETGYFGMQEPITTLVMEAPGGLIEVEAECRDGKAELIHLLNVTSYADRLDAKIEVEGVGTLTVDTAFGGDSFVLVNAADLGLRILPDQAHDIARIGTRITAAANEQLGFKHPSSPWNHISFCQMIEPTVLRDGELTGKSAVAIRPGKIDRSPCGTGCSARMAVMHARDQLAVGQPFTGRSIIDTEFKCRITDTVSIDGVQGIRPLISGRAWIVGVSQLYLDPADPFPYGYRLSDTWPTVLGSSR